MFVFSLGGLFLVDVLNGVSYILGVLWFGILVVSSVDLVGGVNVKNVCVIVLFVFVVFVVMWDLVFVGIYGMCIVFELCVFGFVEGFGGGVNFVCELCNGCIFEYMGEDLVFVGMLSVVCM